MSTAFGPTPGGREREAVAFPHVVPLLAERLSRPELFMIGPTQLPKAFRPAQAFLRGEALSSGTVNYIYH